MSPHVTKQALAQPPAHPLATLPKAPTGITGLDEVFGIYPTRADAQAATQ